MEILQAVPHKENRRNTPAERLIKAERTASLRNGMNMSGFFDKYINEQLNRIRGCDGSSILSERVMQAFEKQLAGLAESVSESTVNGFITDEVLPENPLAKYSVDLITNEQRMNAVRRISEKLQSEELVMPAPLLDILTLRLSDVTDGIIEMLDRLTAHRDEICGALTGGIRFERIEDIALSAGDTHNRGRSVAVIQTDTGKFVYKPRDMRTDAYIYRLAERFFPDAAGIPECITFGDTFGVSRFIAKRRSEGEENAKLFWRNMGGTAAVMKLLGSTDMHFENITCADNKPYILDLETIISPSMSNADYKRLHPELNILKATSLYFSALLPNEHNGRQYSVLMNTEDVGCAPVVNGVYVSVTGYMREFKEGYDDIYRRITENRDEIAREIRSFPADLPVRILIRSTQFYYDTRQKLCRRKALADYENRIKTSEVLSEIMHRNIREEFAGAADSEIKQLERGDIPYIRTFADSRDLFSGSEKIAENVFERSAVTHILDTLSVMSEKDEAFDLELIERAAAQYPATLDSTDAEKVALPVRNSGALPREQALDEAGELFGTLFDICIHSPEGKLFWGYVSDGDYSFRFCEAGLANGLLGIAVFAAAYAYVTKDSRACELAEKAVNEAAAELDRMYDHLSLKGFPRDHAPYLGEAEGIGGILTGLSLLERYTGRSDIAALQEKALSTPEHYDMSSYGAPDRMTGMSGLLSALCRFPEYKSRTDLIRKAADSLLMMKTLDFNGEKLWKPFKDKARPISGAGHGLAGIAEALYAASCVLGDIRYANAADSAISFELSAYSGKSGTWSDLRTYPPEGYMHGYCSGAPGIGIMLARIRRYGICRPGTARCEELAAIAADRMPLNERDHLCCGNSAVAEYYMTAGRHEEAGRVLNAMYGRKKKDGTYRYMSGRFNNSVTGSLFYGVSGIGYEMLRYACPQKVVSVL